MEIWKITANQVLIVSTPMSSASSPTAWSASSWRSLWLCVPIRTPFVLSSMDPGLPVTDMTTILPFSNSRHYCLPGIARGWLFFFSFMIDVFQDGPALLRWLCHRFHHQVLDQPRRNLCDALRWQALEELRPPAGALPGTERRHDAERLHDPPVNYSPERCGICSDGLLILCMCE